jgi:DNA-binding XRE family transcriptional regulator
MIAESAIQAKLFTSCEYVKLHDKGIAQGWLARQAFLMARRYEAIGKRLALLRDGLGITQAELCRQIKCATNRWNQYERGDRQITLAVANRLADEYGASLDWIYRDERGTLSQTLYRKLYRAA